MFVGGGQGAAGRLPGGRQLAVCSLQFAVGPWRPAFGDWQLAVGGWQSAVGSIEILPSAGFQTNRKSGRRGAVGPGSGRMGTVGPSIRQCGHPFDGLVAPEDPNAYQDAPHTCKDRPCSYEESLYV